MPRLFWDASALAKRYILEVGSDTVQALFAAVPVTDMVATFLGYAETYSTLLRHRNRGTISLNAFLTAKAALENEVLIDPDFVLLTIDDAAILDGLALMDRHNVNATDAAILALFLRYTARLPTGARGCALVSADRSLTAAAQNEGLATIDPELVAAQDVPSLLATL